MLRWRRGWLKYDIQLIRAEPYQTETAPQEVAEVGKPGKLSFNMTMPSTENLTNPVPWYSVNVNANQGKKTINTHAISHANPNVGPVTSRVTNGFLSIEVTAP